MKSSRSRSKEKKKAMNGDEFVAVDRALREGNAQLRKQENMSKIILDFASGSNIPLEEHSPDLQLKHASSKKASRTPIKELIDKELSKEMEIKRSSPSVVARLMGLDTLPPVFTKHQKEKGIISQKVSSVGFHDKHNASKGCKPHHTSNNVYQECKDVFEVMEIPKVKKQYNKPSRKEMPILEQSEDDLKPNADLAFAKQKFMDDAFQYCEEYDDAFEDLDSNEDLFMKFLQEPKVFKRPPHDLKCSPPPPHESHITILKPSKVIKADNELSYRSKRITERPSQLLNVNISSHRKYASNLANHSGKEHSSFIPFKSSEPIYEGKTKGPLHSSPIVILKPNMKKAWGPATAASLARSPDNYHHAVRKQERLPVSGRSEVFAGGTERFSLKKVWGPATSVPLARSPENYRHALRRQERFPVSRRSEVLAGGTERFSLESMGHKAKRLREIASDVTKQLRAAGSSTSRFVASSKKCGYIGHESSCDMLGMEDFSLESSRWISNQLYDRDSLNVSSYYSTGSSVSREARKRLSERWKTIKQIQDVGNAYKGSGTLGEMLVSDRDVSRTALNTSISQKTQNVSGEDVARGEILKRWDCPISIGSKDDWNDVWSKNLPWSKSLPPSLASRNLKPARRNKVGISNSGYPQNVLNEIPAELLDGNILQRRSSIQTLNYNHYGAPLYSSGEESEISEREIHVNSEELNNRNHLRSLGEEACMASEFCNNTVAGEGPEDRNLAPQCQDTKFFLLVDGEQVQESTKLPIGEFSTDNPCYLERKDISVDQSQIGSESPIPASAKLDQVSPVSVLERHASEEDKPGSGCFGKISVDLNELRMQLILLKSDSADANAEGAEILSSDEDVGGELIEAFRDDEDRDFSYLLDVLINASELFDTVDREVYGKLEKKYGNLSSWSASERMLLFDLINSNLADVMKSKRHRPIWAREDLVEEVWQVVVKQRNEPSGKLEEKLLLDPKWLDLRDDVDVVGAELERMLTDELVEELLPQPI